MNTIPAWLYAGGAFVIAFGVSLYTVNLMRKLAIKWGVLDRPDGKLKLQKQPVPYLGGVGVYLALLITLALVAEFSSQVVAILLGASIITMVGLIDDFEALSPFEKFVGQVLAAVILIKAGVRTDVEFFADAPGLSYVINVAISLFWYIAITNATNLIDVSDGLCGSVALAASVVFGVIAVLNGSLALGLVAASLGGALLGFLFYNWQPARVYLGDTGSMLVGLLLAALTVLGRYSEHNRVAFVAALFILGVPLFDTALVFIARIRKGKSPFKGGPEHIALRLKKLGFSAKAVAIIGAATTLLLGGVAVITTLLDERTAAVLAASVFVIGVIALAVALKLPEG